MKRFKEILAIAVFTLAILIQSCQKNEIEPAQQETSILPSNFKVDIPDAISGNDYYKSTNIDTLQGNDIYGHLRNFIHVGENAAEMVNDIVLAIALYNLSQPMSFTFISEEDGRVKSVVIIENSEFEGELWEYQLTILDEGSNSTNIGNRALQIFWNRNPIEGIAILNPYNIDRTTPDKFEETMFRIDYSEAGEFGYENHMIVSIDGLPLEDPLDNPYSVEIIKMFVGKNGDLVSVYGNSDHPNATFFTGEVGYDWAFVAAGNSNSDLGVAEVGLPRNTINSADRHTLLVENSIKNVFTNQIYEIWPWIDSTSVNSYLYNTEAPGFFDHGGFVQGGTSPGPQYNPLLGIIPDLTPYNPAEINELEILFKD